MSTNARRLATAVRPGKRCRAVLSPAPAATAATAAMALLLAGSATADPRWWWDDRPIPFSSGVSDLDLDVVPGGPRAQEAIFVAWVVPPTLIEGSLQLSASFDGGCTFCPPVHLASLFDGNSEVDIAVAPFPDLGTYSIQALVTTRGRLDVLHDARTVPLDGTLEELCDALLELNGTITSEVLDEVGADMPDLVGETDLGADPSPTRFHAAWRDEDAVRRVTVQHARDTAGDGTGWEPLGQLSEDVGPLVLAGAPHLSIDWLGDPHAVNAAWPMPTTGEVHYSRSTDGGVTFAAKGGPVAGPPAIVNTVMSGFTVGPVALDSGVGASSGLSPWHGVTWYQDLELPVAIQLDGQYQEGPTSAAPAWGTDLSAGFGSAGRQEGLSLSVHAGGGPGAPVPLFALWTGPGSGTDTEIFVRGGRLEVGAPAPIDIDTFPFPAQRAGDPVASTPLQLTHCTVDATLACVADRSAGSARRAVADEEPGVTHVAWIDDRSGTREVFYKRTDLGVDAVVPDLATSCPTPDDRRITVEFSPLLTCGVAGAKAERVRRYLVYYGTDPAGPYENVDLDGSDPGVPDTIVVDDDGALPDPVVVEIDGLDPGTTYHVIVVPEDEARNVSPPGFSPRADEDVPPVNERSITTPVTCGEGVCLFRATSDALDASGLFVVPRRADDVAFAAPHDVPHGPCPFASGETDPEAVLEPGAPPLIFYQVDGADREIRVEPDRALGTVRITHEVP